MDNPEGHVGKSREVFDRSAAAESHSGCYLVGVGSGEVDAAVAAEAHSYYINAVVVDVMVVGDIIEYIHYFFGIPGSSGVLRGYDVGIGTKALLDGVDGAVALYAREVVSAEACAVKEDDDRFGLDFIVGSGVGSIEPEIVAAFDFADVRGEISGCGGAEGHRYSHYAGKQFLYHDNRYIRC